MKSAIEEALDMKFIERISHGRAHSAGVSGHAAVYSLRWGTSDEYVTKLSAFDGFFAANGNLTHIPNQFFDEAIPNNSLAVIKVVGVIIRNTIGFQTKFGFRRQEVRLSFTQIMRRTGIRSRSTVNIAIQEAIKGSHIRVHAKGKFDPRAGIMSEATTYGIRWDERHQGASLRLMAAVGASEIEPEKEAERRKGKLVALPKSNQGFASKIEPESHPKSNQKGFRNRTDIETTKNNSSKQHAAEEAVSIYEGVRARLIAEGIADRTAHRLMRRFPPERIQRQLDWISSRDIRKSRTGFLIRAIEQDLPQPIPTAPESVPGAMFAANFYAEMAGNPATPIAQPSAAEIRLSAEFIRSIRVLESPGELGRAFAKVTKQRSANTRLQVQTLSLAMRLNADFFVRSQAETHHKSGNAVSTNCREEHEARMLPKFLKHVKCLVMRAEPKRDLDAEFSAYKENQLAKLLAISGRAHEILARQVQTESGLDELCLEFLQRTWPLLVPRFWTWDRTDNDTPFQSGVP